MARAFESAEQELAYLAGVKRELDAAETKDAVVALWQKHYLTVGHRKLGRLLLGQSPEQATRRGRARQEE